MKIENLFTPLKVENNESNRYFINEMGWRKVRSLAKTIRLN